MAKCATMSDPGQREPAQTAVIRQQNQPPEVPPLQLTGERTLPDVPVENYWFQRHLVVYRWIAERVGSQTVVDMGSGEGYGADLLARFAARVVGVEANPEAFEHARLRYRRPNLAFARELIESYGQPADVVVCLQTIEHLADPDRALARFAALAPRLYISTPNVLTLAPPGASRSDNPFHLREYTPQQFLELCARHYRRVNLYGLYHARKLRAHELALRFGWDRLHKALGLTDRFYSRFTPAIGCSDFRLEQAAPQRLDRCLDLVAFCQR